MTFGIPEAVTTVIRETDRICFARISLSLPEA